MAVDRRAGAIDRGGTRRPAGAGRGLAGRHQWRADVRDHLRLLPSGWRSPAGRGPKLSNSERSDEYIIERIKKGKGGAMPAYGSVFSDGQIIAILAYIRGLDD